MLMGDAILPSTSVPCTSTICVMQYSDTKYMKIYKQDEKTQQEHLFAQVELEEMRVKSDYVQVAVENRDVNPTPYSRVEIFLNHPLLQYVNIVDTPGVNEKELLNKAVVEFLPRTDAVIIVIDANGGITTGVRFFWFFGCFVFVTVFSHHFFFPAKRRI